MPRGGTWVFDPNSGGKPIPEVVRQRTTQRLERYAEQHFAGLYARLEIRFRGQFCYVDAYTEPHLPPTGRRRTFPRRGRRRWSGCARRRRTSAGCAIVGRRIIGVSLSTPTAPSTTSYRSSPTGSTSGRPKTPSRSRLNSTSRAISPAIGLMRYGYRAISTRFPSGSRT